jgi:hypothetical protein
MTFMETLRIAIGDLALHKFRSGLATLGIIFGVASVEAMVSISEGARQEALERITALGVDNIIIRSVKPSETGPGTANSSGRSTLQYGLLRKDLEHARITCAPRCGPIRSAVSTSLPTPRRSAWERCLPTTWGLAKRFSYWPF